MTFPLILAKVVADYSGSLVFRNPFELGGIYFSVNLLTTQVSVPVCVLLYHKYYIGGNEIDEMWTWGIAGTLATLWLAAFSFLIFYVIVPEYRKNFFSFQSGWQKTKSVFLENDGNDERKLTVVGFNRVHWRSIEGEVRAWTMANWSRWEAEQPEWFTPLLKASIPDDCIPAQAVIALGGAGRLRKGSASLSFKEAGGLRGSLRKQSLGGDAKVADDGSEEVEGAGGRRRSFG